MEYVTSFKTIKDMGYMINEDRKGLKIFIPNFYNLVNIKVSDKVYDVKLYFLLTMVNL